MLDQLSGFSEKGNFYFLKTGKIEKTQEWAVSIRFKKFFAAQTFDRA